MFVQKKEDGLGRTTISKGSVSETRMKICSFLRLRKFFSSCDCRLYSVQFYSLKPCRSQTSPVRGKESGEKKCSQRPQNGFYTTSSYSLVCKQQLQFPQVMISFGPKENEFSIELLKLHVLMESEISNQLYILPLIHPSTIHKYIQICSTLVSRKFKLQPSVI